ncbi:abortive infection family protein [Kitasatospora sp. NPDC086009]|uniref:abortive infection family protein n=1 Tax=unclassified Kitasatospora TaxID=2633591 RepID=UPI0037C5AB05
MGSAKQLIEVTAKTVLLERGLTVDENAKIPALVKQAHKALALDASAATPGPDGTDAVKKILGGVAAIAVGVAELRNRGYGTGHGQASAPAGLGTRHAHLAADAALTWCELMLDTLRDPAAPWRKAASQSTTGAGRQVPPSRSRASRPTATGRRSRAVCGKKEVRGNTTIGWAVHSADWGRDGAVVRVRPGISPCLNERGTVR